MKSNIDLTEDRFFRKRNKKDIDNSMNKHVERIKELNSSNKIIRTTSDSRLIEDSIAYHLLKAKGDDPVLRAMGENNCDRCGIELTPLNRKLRLCSECDDFLEKHCDENQGTNIF